MRELAISLNPEFFDSPLDDPRINAFTQSERAYIKLALTALPALLAAVRAADLANRRLDMYLPDHEAGLVGEAHDDVSTAQRYLSESRAAVAALEVGE